MMIIIQGECLLSGDCSGNWDHLHRCRKTIFEGFDNYLYDHFDDKIPNFHNADQG